MHTVKYFQVLLFNPNNNISYLFTQLNDQTLLFQTSQFNTSHLLALSLNVELFYLTHWQNPISCYYSGPEWIWERWKWRGTQHPPKLQHYWSLTISFFFSLIFRKLVVGVLPLCWDAVRVFHRPSRLDVPWYN